MLGVEAEDLARVLRDAVGSELDVLVDPRQLPAQDRGEQLVLAVEVGVDELLVGPGALGDGVDAGAGEAMLGELAGRRVEDPFPGGLGVAWHGRIQLVGPWRPSIMRMPSSETRPGSSL
jgi:hypothetical protein